MSGKIWACLFINGEEIATCKQAMIVQNMKQTKYLWFLSPMQFPAQGQWWSILITHFWQMLQ
jgi:hypothetical protein